MHRAEDESTSSPLARAAASYRDMLGWPATAHGWAIRVLAGAVMDAVTMPPELGEPVLNSLRTQRMQHPVIAVPGDPERWTFLVDPAAAPHTTMRTALERHGVRCHPYGSPIELPPTHTSGGPLRWLHPPTFTAPPLPSFPAFAAAVIAAAAKDRTRP